MFLVQVGINTGAICLEEVGINIGCHVFRRVGHKYKVPYLYKRRA